MKISELIKQLTDNLTDEQKEMDADILGEDGSTYTINTILIAAVGGGSIPEGQPIMAAFGPVPE